jgi:hypothetical protein
VRGSAHDVYSSGFRAFARWIVYGAYTARTKSGVAMSALAAAAAHGHPVTEEQAQEAARRMMALIDERHQSVDRGGYMKLWTLRERRFDGAAWTNIYDGLAVIESVAPEADGRFWHHVSVSTSTRTIPKWKELRQVKNTFIGEQLEAYVVFPPSDRYVNIAEVLHLWVCLDAPRGEVLPRFEGFSLLTGRRVI